MKVFNKKFNIIVFSAFLIAVVFLPRLVSASSLAYDLRGSFLIQADSHGETWYLDTENTLRHYLSNDYSAVSNLGDLSIGMSNINLAKIPVAVDSRFVRFDSDGDGLDDRVENAISSNPNLSDSDGDGYDDALELSQHFKPLGSGRAPIDISFSNRFLGKILMQVEHNGELWYVNPQDGLRYYIGDREDLNRIIRYLARGISSVDIANIADSESIKEGAQKNITVELGQAQRLHYYLGDTELGSFPVSAGKASTPTPKGNYTIINKHPKAWSSYGLWMPYWMGLGTGKFGFHELPIWPSGYREGENHLGIAVSHGCIRLGIGPAEYLYNWADIGTPVVIK